MIRIVLIVGVALMYIFGVGEVVHAAETTLFQKTLTPGACYPAPAKPHIINVADYGPDGLSEPPVDDRQGFQAAIDAMASSGDALLIPPGRYDISGTLFVNKAQVQILGVSGGPRTLAGTTLNWKGPPDEPMWRLEGISDSLFESVSIQVSYGYVLDAGIELVPHVSRPSQRNTFRDVFITSTTEQLVTGFVITSDTGVPEDANFGHCFERVWVTNYTNNGIELNSPGGGHTFTSCGFAARGNGANSGVVVGPSGSSFHWLGGGAARMNNAAFSLLGPLRGDTRIEGINMEHMERAIVDQGPLTAFSPHTLYLQRIRSHRDTGTGNPVVDLSTTESVVIEGNFFQGHSVTPIRYTPLFPGSITVRSNDFTQYAEGNAVQEVLLSANGVAAQYANTYTANVNPHRLWNDNHGGLYPSPPFDATQLGANFKQVSPTMLSLAVIRSGLPGIGVYDVTATAYGAQPNDGCDDTWAIQKAIDDATLNSGIVYLPEGEFVINETLWIRSLKPVSLRGSGSGSTRLIWNSDASDRPALKFWGSIHSLNGGFSIIAMKPLQAGIEVSSVPHPVRAGYTSALNAFVDVAVLGNGITQAGFRQTPGRTPWKHGLCYATGAQADEVAEAENRFVPICRIVAAGTATLTEPYVAPPKMVCSDDPGTKCKLNKECGVSGLCIYPEPVDALTDWNNDFGYFLGCRAEDYTEAGWSIEHSQSKSHLLLHSWASSGGHGGVGVSTNRGIRIGSFYMVGGGGNGNRIDIELGGPSEPIGVRDTVWTHSRKFLELGPGAQAAWGVHLLNNEWSGKTAGEIISVRSLAGPVVVRNNIFTNYGTLGTIAFYPTHAGTITVENNDFDWLDSLPLSEDGIVETTGACHPQNQYCDGTIEQVIGGNRYRDANGNPVVL